MGDELLLEQLRRDRSAGMESLVKQYGPLLRYVIGGILRDPLDTEDCFSEVLLSVWRNLDRFDAGQGSLSAWLTAVARNTALNHHKARLRREAHLTEPVTEPAHRDTPEEQLLRRERAERLQTAIRHLGAGDRALLYRKYYYLQSNSQIAAELGTTERAVEGRLYRLRRRLRQELGGDGA